MGGRGREGGEPSSSTLAQGERTRSRCRQAKVTGPKKTLITSALRKEVMDDVALSREEVYLTAAGLADRLAPPLTARDATDPADTLGCGGEDGETRQYGAY